VPQSDGGGTVQPDVAGTGQFSSFVDAAVNRWMPDNHFWRKARAGSAHLCPRGASPCLADRRADQSGAASRLWRRARRVATRGSRPAYVLARAPEAGMAASVCFAGASAVPGRHGERKGIGMPGPWISTGPHGEDWGLDPWVYRTRTDWPRGIVWISPLPPRQEDRWSFFV